MPPDWFCRAPHPPTVAFAARCASEAMSVFRSPCDRLVLNNGVSLPWLGHALHGQPGPMAVERAVSAALEAGCRSFHADLDEAGDSAWANALRASGLARGELFLSIGSGGGKQGYAQTRESFERRLDRLGLETLDLCLLDASPASRFLDAWQALEELHGEARVRAIGLRGFPMQALRELLGACDVRPALNQIELHPLAPHKSLRQFCAAQNLQLRALPPLPGRRRAPPSALLALAERHGCSAAQIAQRWCLQRDLPVLTEETDPALLRRAGEVFDFHLDPDELALLDALAPDAVSEAPRGLLRLLPGGRRRAVATAA